MFKGYNRLPAHIILVCHDTTQFFCFHTEKSLCDASIKAVHLRENSHPENQEKTVHVTMRT